MGVPMAGGMTGAASTDTLGRTCNPELPRLDWRNTWWQMGVYDAQHSFIAMLHFLASLIVAKPDGGTDAAVDAGNIGACQSQNQASIEQPLQ